MEFMYGSSTRGESVVISERLEERVFALLERVRLGGEKKENIKKV
jgi:hypothetical protein